MSERPIRLLIVDDEALARRRLMQLLEPYGDRYDIREVKNAVEGLEAIKAHDPQILLLDIEMPELSGFDLLGQFEEPKFQVIFQTAYDEFAIKAFEVSACDYLLKPVTAEGLDRALKRASSRLTRTGDGADLPSLLKEQAKREPLRRFLVKAGSRVRMIEEDQVLYFSSKDHVSYIHLADIHFAIDLSLSRLEELVDPTKFLRIHRNSVIALNEVESFTTTSDMTVTLKNGETLKVARDRHKAVREHLTAGEAERRR